MNDFVDLSGDCVKDEPIKYNVSKLVTTVRLPFWQRVKMVFKPVDLRVSVSFTLDNETITINEITGKWV